MHAKENKEQTHNFVTKTFIRKHQRQTRKQIVLMLFVVKVVYSGDTSLAAITW